MNTLTGLSLGRASLGVVALARPELVSKLITPTSPANPLLTQWFGSREIALAAATLLTTGRARTTVALIGMGVDAADAVTGARAISAGGLPQASGAGTVGIALGAVVAGALGLRVRKRTVVEQV